MLSNDSQAIPRTRRTLSILGVAAIVVLLLVFFRWTTSSHFAGPGGAITAHAADAAPNDKPVPAAERNDKAAPAAVARNVRAAVEFLPRPSPEEERILTALATPVDVEFLDVPLEDCLSFIGGYEKLPQFTIFLDRATLTDEGVALDQPITLKLRGLRLESVLHLLLRPVQLEFLVRDDVLMITTSAKAGEVMFTRTYPVGDLYRGRTDQPEKPAPPAVHDKPSPKVGFRGFIGGEKPATPEVMLTYQGFGGGQAPQNDQNKGAGTDQQKAKDSSSAPSSAPPVRRQPFNDLVEALKSTIEPDSWEELSGPGSYTYVSETKSLVIRQTWQIHRQILQLLRDLREAKGLPAGESR